MWVGDLKCMHYFWDVKKKKKISSWMLYLVCIWIALSLLKTEKFIAKNTITKYFLLIKITIHPFLSFGWSMNSAMD